MPPSQTLLDVRKRIRARLKGLLDVLGKFTYGEPQGETRVYFFIFVFHADDRTTFATYGLPCLRGYAGSGIARPLVKLVLLVGTGVDLCWPWPSRGGGRGTTGNREGVRVCVCVCVGGGLGGFRTRAGAGNGGRDGIKARAPTWGHVPECARAFVHRIRVVCWAAYARGDR